MRFCYTLADPEADKGGVVLIMKTACYLSNS